ncbi:hypothetical protein DBA20_25445 [Pandoraea capi]|nr:hypothetical protein [Pandoraea sp. LA3]MDN4586334.1 hypothetical protein [Pandoraea capi]
MQAVALSGAPAGFEVIREGVAARSDAPGCARTCPYEPIGRDGLRTAASHQACERPKPISATSERRRGA